MSAITLNHKSVLDYLLENDLLAYYRCALERKVEKIYRNKQGHNLLIDNHGYPVFPISYLEQALTQVEQQYN